MGQSKSKNKAELINNTVQKVIFSTIQNCSGPINQQQIINIKNSRNVFISNVEMNQYASINMNCVNKIMNSTDFSSKLKSELTQVAQSEAAALNVNKSISENISKTVNNLTQVIQNTMSQTCSQSILQQQALIIDSSQNAVVQNVKFNQSATAFVKCLQDSQNYNELVGELASTIDQTAKSKTEGLFGLGSSGSSGSSSSSSIIFIVCCILIVGMGAMGSLGGNGEGEGDSE